jgi:DNA-binding transcriptional MerR regulator
MNWSIAHQPATITDLSAILGVSPHRLRRILDNRGVAPAFRVGHGIRLYSRDQVDTIATLIRRDAACGRRG